MVTKAGGRQRLKPGAASQGNQTDGTGVVTNDAPEREQKGANAELEANPPGLHAVWGETSVLS